MMEKQLHVLLVHRESDVYRHLTGWWSYPVPEFRWTSLKVKPDWFNVDMSYAAKDTDLVVLDDWIYGQFKHLHIPLIYVTVDSARSAAQRDRNRKQAAQADLILCDSDDLNNFAGLGKPVRRFAYAVNESLFFPREKEFDVVFLCWPTPERREVARWCDGICKQHGWSFVTGTYDWPDYARFLSMAKVVVHKSHVVAARSWRIFDVMASRGCLLTTPLPCVSGDGIEARAHYRTYTDAATLEAQLEYLLTDDRWRPIAEAGYAHIMANHTWRTRATQLRATLTDVFKSDPERMAVW